MEAILTTGDRVYINRTYLKKRQTSVERIRCMRKLAVNICATTGISLILLAVIGLSSGGTYLYLVGVFQVLATNMMIHVGMLLVSHMALKYPLLEALVDIALILVMICGQRAGIRLVFQHSALDPVHSGDRDVWRLNRPEYFYHMRREVQEINMLIVRTKFT